MSLDMKIPIQAPRFIVVENELWERMQEERAAFITDANHWRQTAVLLDAQVGLPRKALAIAGSGFRSLASVTEGFCGYRMKRTAIVRIANLEAECVAKALRG